MTFNIIFTILMILSDQLFKYFATLFLKDTQAITVIPHFLGLTYTLNTGAAFSILSGKVDFLIIITSIALIIMAYFIFIKKIKSKIENFSFLLIFAGGVGNLIDRIMSGVVVDYLEFLFIDFPIFNLADIFVCCGVAIFATNIIFDEYNTYKRKKGDIK